MKQFIDKPFQVIALVASLTFSKSTEAISQTFHWDNPKQSTTIVVNEETQPKIPSISHESKVIKTAGGHPKTLSKAILLAIEDLKLKGNMNINEKFTTEHIHEITATFEQFIIENFSKFATKLPNYSVKLTNSIYKIITVDCKDGKNTISITITISGTKAKPLITISAKGKKTITNEYGLESTEQKENTVTTLPNKHSSQSKDSEGVGIDNRIPMGKHLSFYTFSENTGAGLIQVLRDEEFGIKLNPILASRSGSRIQQKLNSLNNGQELKIKAGTTIQHDPDAKTIICMMDGLIITTSYDENNIIISTSNTGDLKTNNVDGLIPTTNSNTKGSNGGSEVSASVVSNPITINEKGFATITNKGIGRSLEACLLQEADISEKNAEVLGSRIGSKINTRLNTHIFANGGSLQIANSKVKVVLGGKNELEVTVICAEPIQGKKGIQYSKTPSTTIFNIMYGPNNEIIVFNKSN